MRVPVLVALVLIAGLGVALRAQDDMPEAPGKAITLRYCTGCHGADQFSSSRKSGNDWDQTITAMTEKNLAFASDADYAAVLDYLSSCLGPVSKKVNINKAAACELTRMLEISDELADAIVAYREKNGTFKDLDGLKKVAGVDSAALDAKKDTIAF
jgi:competence ComEA-like helix-hairpin-helix protein